MEKSINRKILAIGVLFLFLGASAILGVSASYTNGQQQNIQTVQKNPIGKTGLTADDYLISTNTGNDYHPRVATNSKGQMIVVYEQEVDQFTKQVPVVYSSDNGKTWTSKVYFDSTSWTSGSGILQYPDIVYNPHNDTLYIVMVDPNGDMYNTANTIVSADIATVANASMYRISGTGSTVYTYCAGATSDNFYISMVTVDYTSYIQTTEVGFWTTGWVHPNGMGGFYYDGGSNIKLDPMSEIEMGQNDNRIFAVGESTQDSVQNVFIKSDVNDETLMTNGEMQNGMYKYSDIEQWPGELFGAGTDPDVSGSGANVCLVYVTGGDIKCLYSTCDAHTYEPGFSWKVSTVDTGASTPSVYMTGSTVYCAYVKGGNLYLKTSSDAGATWGAAEQRNAQAGTVMSDPGSVAVTKLGIIFQDTRDGHSHLYCSPIAPIAAPDVPTITGPASGTVGKSTDYVFTTTDPKGGQVFYYVDWGDGQNSGWQGPYASGAAQTISHTWATKGDFTIKAKAKDTGGHESEYATLPVTMPITITPPFLQFLEKLFERFPNAFPVLRQLLGY